MITHYILSFLLINLLHALRWNSSGYVSDLKTIISLKNVLGTPLIDVSVGEQIVIVKDYSRYTSPITVYCFIGGYDELSDITFTFCKENTGCTISVKDNDPFMSITAYGMTMTTESKFERKKGLKLEMFMPQTDDVDISGNYYCETRDANGNFMIRSNNIQMRDRMYWEQNIVLTNENIKTPYLIPIQRNSTPFTFPCAVGGLNLNKNRPSWISKEFISPVLWRVCISMPKYDELTVGMRMSFANCKSNWDKDNKYMEPKALDEMPQWKSYVNSNGELVIFDIDIDKQYSGNTYSLMCYTKKNGFAVPINTYYRENDNDFIKTGVVFDGSMAVYKRPLTALSPLEQDINIYARKKVIRYDLPTVSIYARYTASSTASAFWTHNDAIVNNGDLRTSDNYKLNFIADITSAMAGNYTLTVADDTDKLVFKFKVSVLGSPTLEDPDCLPWVRHVWENENTMFSCTYKDRPKELKVSINGEEISPKNSLEASQIQLANPYPYLSLLNFSMSPTNYQASETVTMTYKVFNIRKTQGQSKYQDHTFMFEVSNDYGFSVKSTSIYAVPKLRLQRKLAPESCNCTSSCSSAVQHVFLCRIDTEVYANKDLNVDHFWTINSHRLEQKDKPDNKFAHYFLVDPVTKDLTMLPIVSNDSSRDEFVKSELADNYIICHLNLISVVESKSKFNMNSISDPSLWNIMRAKITLDYQPLNTAYIYWIVAIILALLLIVIMVVLLMRYCMHNKGETYKLDKIEREYGYDPEKEVQEEMFKPYEREDQGPESPSAFIRDRNLSLTSHSVGSADDGELDNYDLDPSNFSEDGSIIGKYGANPRNVAPVT